MGDPRKDKFIETYGELYQVELDALPALIPDEFRDMIIESVDQFYDEKMYYRTLREIEKEYPPDKLKQYVENSMAYYDEMYSPHDRDYFKDDDDEQ